MKMLAYVGTAFLLASALTLAQADPSRIALAAARPTADMLANRLGRGHALVAVGVTIDELGQAHVRYQQTYRSVPVFEGEAIVHVDLASETVLNATDALLAFGPFELRAALGSAQAATRAHEHFNMRPGFASRNDIVILVDEGVASLSWQVRLTGEDSRGPNDKVAIVDAQGRGVLRSWDNVQTASAAGTGKTFFNGTVPLTTNSLSRGGYELRDPSRGGQYTINMNNRTSGGSVFTDSDNTWGNFTLSDVATVGTDAQYGTAVTWDYYKNVHGRNGIANNNKGAYNRVHYSRNYNNAFWSDSCFCMTYGDGDGTTFNPFDSLDVAGHEMSHGVTSRTAKLTYAGESGGLNEATSDIFGTMVEYYANNPADVPDYLIGERLYKAGGRALRSMIKPSVDGVSADCWYSGVGSLNVHYSSGVGNHFFYLLAEGTNAGVPSPTCVTGDTRVANGAGTVAGIGRAKAEKIWYRALTTYMTASTNYAAARTATLNAARDLYGATSAEAAAVTTAWNAVNRF